MLGQSEIMATLIMVMASVLLSSIILAWAYSALGQSQINVSQAISRENARATELYVIEEVRFVSGTPGKIVIHVRNASDIPVRIAGIYITRSSDGAVLFTCEVPSPFTILPRTASRLPELMDDAPGNAGCSRRTGVASILGQTVEIRLGSLGGNLVEKSFKAE